MNSIVLSISEHTDPDGQVFIKYTPKLKTDCLACGELTFPAWEALKANPAEHGPTQLIAMRSARRALNLIAIEATKEGV